MSLGRNTFRLLHRLRRRPNVRLVDPYTSTHELIRRSEAVVVISSTVGLEALLYDKPVLTLGRAVLRRLRSHARRRTRSPTSAARCRSCCAFRPDPERIAQFLHWRCGSATRAQPLLVDRSEENARTVAETLERAALGLPHVGGRGHQPAAAGSAHQA